MAELSQLGWDDNIAAILREMERLHQTEVLQLKDQLDARDLSLSQFRLAQITSDYQIKKLEAEIRELENRLKDWER